MEMYMDEKWKLAKKGSRNSSSTRRGLIEDHVVAAGGTARVSYLRRSASAVEPRTAAAVAAATSARSFTSRCSRLVKEQRAKFYIVRRCVTMLICWRDYA